ncbi:ABC transporter substrate-binding protein [Consotaella aegiceratis]|uniref:ABC transporter substrate-binding protein n=1 Tax=Consotaella aegiceratis TaxID=3097961 RepID=UPI002F3EB48A
MSDLFRTLATAASLAALMAAPTVAQAADLPSNIRLVIGSKSTGGDTYQNSAIVAEALSEKLGINIKVDAVGESEAFKAIERDRRGTTMMIFHDQSYLGNLYGIRGYEDIFSTYKIGPTVAINPGNAFAVPKNSPYQTMDDIFAAAANGERIRVAIQPGGVSEIGFSAMKNAAEIRNPGSEKNIVAVNTGSQADKNQLLFDGQADVINASVQANEQFTQLPADDQKAMRFVWLTSSEETLEQAPEQGMGDTTREDLLSFASPQVSVTLDGEKDFTFDKEFFFLFNKDIDPEIVEALDTALGEVYADGEIQKKQTQSFFIPDFRPSGEALAHLQEKNDEYAEVIKAITE